MKSGSGVGMLLIKIHQQLNQEIIFSARHSSGVKGKILNRIRIQGCGD